MNLRQGFCIAVKNDEEACGLFVGVASASKKPESEFRKSFNFINFISHNSFVLDPKTGEVSVVSRSKSNKASATGA